MKTLIAGLSFLVCTTGYSQNSFTVHFDLDKYQLTDKARSQLDSFLSANKKALSAWDIKLNGYCDATGSDRYNDKLSIQRVTAVKEYLFAHSIAPVSFSEGIGHGEKEPLNENSTEEERRLNRRVEISFVGIVKPDKVSLEEKVADTTTTKNNKPVITSLKERIADTSITTGSNITLRNINFVGGMHQMLPESTPMLEELLDAMKTYPNLVIRIEGHICCLPTKEDAIDIQTGREDLSEARAKAVRDHLIEMGIEKRRVLFIGFGHSSPIYPYPEKSEEERIQNRRIEIRIISK